MKVDLSRLKMDALEKGSVIPTAVLSECVGLRPTHRDFPLRCLEVKEAVVKHFRDNRGLVVTVCYDQDTLRVLGDSEASEYNHDRFTAGLRCMRAAHRRNLEVDTSGFGDDERRRHEKRLSLQARIEANTRLRERQEI